MDKITSRHDGSVIFGEIVGDDNIFTGRMKIWAYERAPETVGQTITFEKPQYQIERDITELPESMKSTEPLPESVRSYVAYTRRSHRDTPVKVTNKNTGQWLTGRIRGFISDEDIEKTGLVHVDGDDLRAFNRERWDVEEIKLTPLEQFRAFPNNTIFRDVNGVKQKVSETQFIYAYEHVPHHRYQGATASLVEATETTIAGDLTVLLTPESKD